MLSAGGMFILSVCGALAALARPLEAPPEWTHAHTAEDREALSAYFGVGVQGYSLTVHYDPTAAGQLNIHAEAAPNAVTIRLEGDGWQAPTPLGRQILQQNIAHELAHLAQFQAGPTEHEPLWWHEGTAEVMALEALAQAGLWNASRAAMWRAEATAHCGDALGRGTLEHLWEHRDRNALYACSYVMVETLARASGRSVVDLRAGAARAMGEGQALSAYLEEVAGHDIARSLEAFATRSYTHVNGAWVVEQFRAGEL
ncbi:MAG: hypothetical protein AAF986_10820 [Pseudomonadota bacterium]